MFPRIRTAKQLKVKATGSRIEVGYSGWVVRVVPVHQFVPLGYVSRKCPTHKYLARQLLGLSTWDKTHRKFANP